MLRSINKLILLFVFILLCFSSTAYAGIAGIDEKRAYDVYFYSGDNTSFVKNVRILGIQDVAGKKFIVIRPYGFKLSDTEGLISLDSVAAILPNQDFRVEQNQNINVRY